MAKSSFYSGTGITNNEQNAIDGAKNAAEAARDAAQVAQAAAETAETNAETAATSASGQATIATTKASEASTSVTTAATHASTATTKASEASTSATNAATSETNAATSATNAATSETNAASSASTATTKASEASTSASTAATKASEAASSATTASTQATNAATSATNAASSETNAATSATNAASSATTASTQATNAASSATTASTQATNASSSASTATTKASEASSSASSASAAQTAAEGARDSALAAFDSFDDRYLGVKSSDPTTDNDGDALSAGLLYFSSTDTAMKVYSGSAWVDAYVSGQDYMSLTGGTMTGDITFNSTQLFDGRDVSNDGSKLDGIESNATADQTAAEIKTAYESNSDTNAFTDADHSKLNAIEASADVTDAANVNPLVDSHLNISTASSGEYLSWNGSDYDWASVPAGYANSDVDTHLNTSSASSGQYLNWNGSDYAWSTVDLSNVDAVTVDGLDSTQFLRSDANDTATGQLTFNAKLDVANNTYLGWGGGTDRPSVTGNKSNNRLTFYTGGAERFHIDNDGVDITGAINTTGMLTVDNDSGVKVVYGTETANVFYTGYGINSQRTSTYIRPSTDNTSTLYLGTTDASADWNTIAMKVGSNDNVTINGNKVFHAGNDGSGSGLDADTVDGIQASSFLRSDADDTTSGVLTATDGIISEYLDIGTEGNRTIQGLATRATIGSSGGYGDLYLQYFGGNVYTVNGGGTLYANGNAVWHDGNTGTVIDYVGDITSQDWNTYIDGTEASWARVVNMTGSNKPPNYTYGTALNISVATANKFQLYASHTGSAGNGLYFRTGWGTDYKGWAKIYDSVAHPALSYVDTAGGSYGTIKVDDDRSVTWAGYSIRDQWVFMSNGAGASGIYNDTDNVWAIYFTQNGATNFYHNGSNVMETSSSNGVIIGGTASNNPYDSVSSTRLMFGGGDSNAVGNYYIGTNLENYGGNYSKLDLRWHTGIRMGRSRVMVVSVFMIVKI